MPKPAVIWLSEDELISYLLISHLSAAFDHSVLNFVKIKQN